MKLIRGKRIYEQLLLETTFAELENQTLRTFPNTPNRHNAVNPVQITQIKLTPSVDAGELLVEAVAKGGQNYQPKMLFEGVEYQEEDAPDNITFTASNGDEYHVAPISLKQNNVKVFCTCLDFYYRFATWNANDKSLLGTAPPPYIRKTQTRPPVNPSKTPGVCKHLLKLATELVTSKIVKE